MDYFKTDAVKSFEHRPDGDFLPIYRVKLSLPLMVMKKRVRDRAGHVSDLTCMSFKTGFYYKNGLDGYWFLGLYFFGLGLAISYQVK